MTPEVGMGATELLVTDTVAHVVTRVTAKYVWTRRVETGPAQTITMHGPFPVTREDGILDKPIGDEVQWYRRKNDTFGEYATRKGWQRIHFGDSYRRVDYSY